MKLRKGYSDGPEGQIHWRIAEPVERAGNSDLYCFSPAPFSSIAYSSILPHLAHERRVIAPDYPGQGGSDGGSATPSIESYTASMLSVIQDLSGNDPVSVLGFHSGCLVAAEVQRQMPSNIAKTVLIDVPAFDPETRSKYAKLVGAQFEPSGDMEAISKAWDMAVTKRLETQTLDACYAMLADTIGNGSRMNATFHAAFSYDVEAKVSSLKGKTTIIATQSSLLEPSRSAAKLIPGCELIELLEIERSVLDANAEKTAQTVIQVLDQN